MNIRSRETMESSTLCPHSPQYPSIGVFYIEILLPSILHSKPHAHDIFHLHDRHTFPEPNVNDSLACFPSSLST